jgi:hypothetical protein
MDIASATGRALSLIAVAQLDAGNAGYNPLIRYSIPYTVCTQLPPKDFLEALKVN